MPPGVVSPDLHAAFAEHFGAAPPVWHVRVPGRVNLIGEHIDYNHLSVLPMAIGRHVHALVRPRDDARVRIVSLSPGFPARDFVLGRDISPDPAGDWGNYVKAAAQALVREHGRIRGCDAVVGSTLPVAAGLSSSSALVIATALALLTANDRPWAVLELAHAMAAAERYTGTQGGGMDQAIVLGAVEGTACRVDFAPLQLEPVPVPPSWRFIVAHSLSRAEKSGTAQATYNRRTAECRDALARIGFTPGAGGGGYREAVATMGTKRLLELGARRLEPPLAQRFRHVVTEAARVHEAEAALRAADLGRFGALLLASHASLRDDYEVSSPALDALVTLAVDAGAAGARLTGAGMGGCALVVATADAAPHVLAQLRTTFYAAGTFDGPLDDHLFAVEPAGGAIVRAVDDMDAGP